MSRLTGRGLVGLLCAALLNALLLALLMPLGIDLNPVSFVVTFMIFVPYSVLGAALVGLPLYALASKLEWLNFYAVLLLGLAAGLVVGGVFVLTRVGNWTWLLNMAGTSTLSAVLSSRLLLTSRPKV
jgi:hypothetical protein